MKFGCDYFNSSVFNYGIKFCIIFLFSEDSKIFGGAEVILATEAPWVASVEIYIGGVVLDSCGGTILSKTLILTAARCLLK